MSVSRRICALTPFCAGAAVLAFSSFALAGPYSVGGGTAGSTSIPAADSRFVGWATSVKSITRGPIDIANPSGDLASFGVPENALGPSDATTSSPYSVVSLGDGGSITLGFDHPIINGTGADFAVFENGFGSTFLELGYVEVSTDGVTFARFPSISLTQSSTQVASFGQLDPTNIYNLAGHDKAGWGTPFDLEDVKNVAGIDVTNINFVRIIDVVGRISPTGGYSPSLDSLGNIINDPYPTAFSSGGFDLDAVGVINAAVPEPGAMAWAVIPAAGLLRRRR